jgi:hypothetical protein
MALLYPHKQTVLIALICLGIVGAAAYSAYGSQLNHPADAPAVAIADNSQPSSQEALPTDTDWQKQFTGTITTSPSNAAKGKAAQQSDFATTTTDQMGREFFAQFIALKQVNLLSNPDIVNQTTENVVVRNFDSIQPVTYALTDIPVIDSTDPVALSTYASGVASIIGSYAASKGEGAIVQEYLTTSDASTLSQLDPVVASYKHMLSSLRALRTPQIAANDELDLVNALSTLEFASQALRAIDSDNIRGLAGSSLHVQGINLLLSALGNINDDLGTYGVSLKIDQSVFTAMLN